MCLVDHIQNNSIDNGVIFLNSSNLELPLANLITQIHGLKRILLIKWDVNHNLRSQNDFYDNPK